MKATIYAVIAIIFLNSLIIGIYPLYLGSDSDVVDTSINIVVNGSLVEEKWNENDDLVFIHHSCGSNWLKNGLNIALLNKSYIDERNDIYYNDVVSNDSGRPGSLGAEPGDNTDMNHWILWFNDYLKSLKIHDCDDGNNRIIMFKSCYPNSNIAGNGTEPGSPFSSTKTIANYKAVYRHYSGSDGSYSRNGYTYYPLEKIFSENPDILFIPVTAPPRHFGPTDATDDAEAKRARIFNNWLKEDWLQNYNSENPGLNNVAVFDWFDILSYPDDHTSHPNRLRTEYGGNSGNSHPNTSANLHTTDIFAEDPNNFLDRAWQRFNNTLPWSTFGYDNRRTSQSPFNASHVDSEVRWKFKTGTGIISSPSVDSNGTIYIGSNNGKLYALYENGTEKWNYSTEGAIRSSSSAGKDGTLYFGSDDGNLYALSKNGTMKWRFETDHPVRSSPAIGSDGSIYFGSNDNRLYSLYPNGTERWNITTGGDITSSPAIDTMGNILIGSMDGKMYSIATNGTELWNFSTGGGISSTPSVDLNGTIYFGSNDRLLYCIGEDGVHNWNFSTGGKISSSPAIDTTGNVYFGSDDSKLYCIKADGTSSWSYDSGEAFRSSPSLGSDGTLFIGSDDNKIRAFHPNGSLKWNISTGGKVSSSPAIDGDGSIYIGSEDGYLYSFGIRPPSPPQGVNLLSGKDFINLSWKVPENHGGRPVTEYRIYRGNLSEVPTIIAVVDPSVRYYNDSLLYSNRTCFYYITAVNSEGESENSEEMILDLEEPELKVDSTSKTGTTGDVFQFNVTVMDDISVEGAWVEYWFGNDVHSNATMNGQYHFFRNITIPEGSTLDLHYIIHASDTGGNWLTTSARNITILDNDNASFTDNSSNNATTGDTFTFDITAMDNIGIDSVRINWSHGILGDTEFYLNSSDGSNWTGNIMMDQNTSDLVYTVTVEDISGNILEGQNSSVRVRDDDNPSIDDRSNTTGSSGDVFIFNITATDNIEIGSVSVNWSHGELGENNRTLTDTGNGVWKTTIHLDHSMENMTYRIIAMDRSGNHVYGEWTNVSVIDNDEPSFIDHTPLSGSTGDPFTFNVSASDNLGISSVKISWTHHDSGGKGIQMILNKSSWHLTVMLSNSISSMYYNISVTDLNGNSITSDNRTISVRDNDNPFFLDHSPSDGTTGDEYYFNISAKDNIGIRSVSINWSHGEKEGNIIRLKNTDGNNWSSNIVLDHDLDDMRYLVIVSDYSTNTIYGEVTNVTVLDNDNPSFSDHTLLNATTGDEYYFNITAKDNIGIRSVSINWSHGRKSMSGMELKPNGYSWSGLVLIDHNISRIKYWVTVWDTSNNSVTGEEVSVSVRDNDLPVMTDNSLDSGTTGDGFVFNISAEDNIEVSSVLITWQHGLSGGEDIPLEWKDNRYWNLIVILDPVDSDLEYSVKVIDSSNNILRSGSILVEISDNDLPVFKDLTGNNASTGDPFTFEIYATDNSGIGSISVVWEHGSRGGIAHLEETRQGSWTTEIILDQSTFDLEYHILVIDASSNKNTSKKTSIEVRDNDEPSLEDLSGSLATTGDHFHISILPLDNILVENVTITWHHGYQNGMEIPLEEKGEGIWTIEIFIDDHLSDLIYTITITDPSNNRFTGAETVVEVIDDDEPMIFDLVPSTFLAGYAFDLEVRITDNTDLDHVLCDWSHGSNGGDSLAMDEVQDDIWTLRIETDNSLDDISFLITARDRSGNTAIVELGPFSVIDMEKPVLVEDRTDGSAYGGFGLNFSVIATDNIAVRRVMIEHWFHGEDRVNLSLEGNNNYSSCLNLDEGIKGDLHYIIHIIDSSGNRNNSEVRIVEVLDGNLLDSDDDGIPDLFELNEDLNPDDPNDSELDPDNDGLTNLEEYLNGTDMREKDTDLDGIPDGWEVRSGLDPLVGSADDDTDGDGRTDLEEFLKGSDPNVSDVAEEDDPVYMIPILVFLIILIIVLGSLILVRSGHLGRTEKSQGEGQNGERSDKADPIEGKFG